LVWLKTKIIEFHFLVKCIRVKLVMESAAVEGKYSLDRSNRAIPKEKANGKIVI